MEAGRGLVLSEQALLHDILTRRAPDLAALAESIGSAPLDADARDRIRRVVVDELCELPDGEVGRAALHLQELLTHLGDA